MKRRHAYLLLFCVPALLASVTISVLLVGGVAGGLWLFVLGDNPWPQWSSWLLESVFAVAFAASCIALLTTAYTFGKREEASARINPAHIAISAGITLLLVLLAVVHQYRVGNLGPKSDGELCQAYCMGKGFAGSGMPRRDSGSTECTCFDAQGREAAKIQLEEARRRPEK